MGEGGLPRRAHPLPAVRTTRVPRRAGCVGDRGLGPAGSRPGAPDAHRVRALRQRRRGVGGDAGGRIARPGWWRCTGGVDPAPVPSIRLVANWDTVCEIASSLPGAQLDGPHAEAPAWRVNGKVIVRRNLRLDDTAEGEGGGEVIAIRVEEDERAALLEEDPATFFLTEHWAGSRNTSVLVRLATVERDQLAELVTEAWRRRSTTRQRLQH